MTKSRAISRDGEEKIHDKTPQANPDFEAIASILETIAGTFPDESNEARAIRDATEAYLFLHLHLKLRRSYEAFRQAGLGGLTAAQNEHLREMGIDVQDD
jgi:hypothetical protein